MLDTLTLDQLRVFVAIVDQGSFSAAARSLQRAQSAISNAVANLERALNVKLFDRSDWKPQLTEYGRALLIDARSVIREADKLKERARSISEGLEPELSLIVDVYFPTKILVTMIKKFQNQFPSVTLKLRSDVLGSVPEAVIAGDYGLGIQGSLPEIATEVVSYPLSDVPIEPVAAASHPFSRHSKLDRSALSTLPQIILTDHSRRTDGRQFSVYSSQTIITSDLGSKHEMLRDGLGWGFMPLSIGQADIDSGQLVILDLKERTRRNQKMPMHLIHRFDRSPGPAARWFMQSLLERSND